MTPVVVDRRAFALAVEARLRAQVANAHGYVGEAGDVPTKPGGDQRVQPYWVLHTSAGAENSELDLADTAVALDGWVQITCAGDSDEDVRALVTRVDAALYRWVPVIPGYECGRLKPPLGYDPGPIQPDKSVKPHRFWVPLQYQTTVTAT